MSRLRHLHTKTDNRGLTVLVMQPAPQHRKHPPGRQARRRGEEVCDLEAITRA